MTEPSAPATGFDTYDIYSEWFLRHYGRPFACTREQWQAWCRKPQNDIHRDADQREIDREIAEGWAADQRWGV